MIDKYVKEYADANEVKLLRHYFANSFSIDPTFRSYEDDLEYCKSKLFEPHEELTPLTTDRTSWTKGYWDKLLRDLNENFSEKRFYHMRDVVRVIPPYAEKYQEILEAEHRVREEAERKAREEAERKVREEAERKAREEAERKAREDAERKAREEAERKAREEAERKAQEEAQKKTASETTQETTYRYVPRTPSQPQGKVLWGRVALAAAVVVILIILFILLLG